MKKVDIIFKTYHQNLDLKNTIITPITGINSIVKSYNIFMANNDLIIGTRIRSYINHNVELKIKLNVNRVKKMNLSSYLKSVNMAMELFSKDFIITPEPFENLHFVGYTKNLKNLKFFYKEIVVDFTIYDRNYVYSELKRGVAMEKYHNSNLFRLKVKKW